ncbi:MAG: TonB-dependent siderophore receptor [Zoogloeaceae bacterium]|nr:TonB-dependent siderophore receptor [Zoogloeaceae bacterium]
MKTRQQKFQAKHGVICAFLALAEGAQAQETPVVLEPVDVTGERYLSEISVGGKEPVKPREIPQSVSVITRERIEDQGLTTLPDALRQVTGLNLMGNGTSQTVLRSRGFTLNTLQFDGIPSSFVTLYQQLDLAIYERIEVLRGPAGLFQGTADPGGAVNLVRKRAQKAFAASGSISTGSWSNYNTVADVTGPFNESGSVRGRVVVSATDREYFYDTTKTDKHLGYGTLDWDITPSTTLSVAFAFQNEHTDAPFTGLPAWAYTAGSTDWNNGKLLDVPRSTNINVDWGRHEWESRDWFAELNHRFANGWNATAKLRRRNQDYFFKNGLPNGQVNRSTGSLAYQRYTQDANYEQDVFDLYLAGTFRLFGREHRAVLGYNMDTWHQSTKFLSGAAVTVPFGHPEQVSEIGQPVPASASKVRQSGYYGQVRLRLADPLTAIVGARVSDYSARSRANPAAPWVQGAKTTDEVTPYAGVIFDVNKQVSLYASYSDIFIPQTQQKFGGGVLEPRVGKQYEIGSKGEFLDGRLIGSIAYFYLHDTNKAYTDPDHPGFSLNAGEGESKGWEIEVSGAPAPGWNIQAGYTYLKTKYLKDSTKANEGLPLSALDPKHMFKLWGSYRFGGETLNGLSVGLGANYLSETKGASTGAGALRKQDGYTVVDAFLSYRIDKNLSLSLNANNLFDKTYYSRIGGNVGNIYGAPRNFTLTLRATY